MTMVAETRSYAAPPRYAFVRTPAYFLFLAILGVQGFHVLEHVVQIVQRYALGIGNGAGIVGSVADTEPVHVVYNGAYLTLVVAAYFALGLHRDRGRVGTAVVGLVTFAVCFQAFHFVEHAFKIVQYVQLGFQNGTGGIFGAGPGGLIPLFPVPLLHLAYNTIAYIPMVLAFILLVRGPAPREISAR